MNLVPVVAVLHEFRYISLIINFRHFVETRMRQKLLAVIITTLSLLVTSCGDGGGTASGKWVGEVFASANSKSSTVVGEFDSYDECLEETQKQAKSGIFNCGVNL